MTPEQLSGCRAAAENGDADAQFKLGYCYDNGSGVKKDHAEAVKWYRKAAEQGHPEANLALAADDGVTQENIKDVLPWILKIAERGNARAQYGMGVCHENGIGVQKDPKLAVYWYRLAADKGDAKAQYKLALCYGSGDGVEEDLDQAAYYLHQAAGQGFAPARQLLEKCNLL